jgi:large subunit ribosomal protein L22
VQQDPHQAQVRDKGFNMKTKYAFQGMKENMARAITKDAGISTKASIEIANFLRGKTTIEAKTILERVLKKKQAIPFKRFTDGVGHRKGAGIAAGRYPEKASELFLTLIKQCEANAQAKGLSTDLRIVHLVAQKGTNMFRHGRLRRRSYKRTHLEIVLEEMEKTEKVKKQTKNVPIKKEVKEVKDNKITETIKPPKKETKIDKEEKTEETPQTTKKVVKKAAKKTTKKTSEEQK